MATAPIANPDGSYYFPDQNYTVLKNGMMIGGHPSPADMQRFSQLQLPPGGDLSQANNPQLFEGAVNYPNGSVYFPRGDFFVLPNGRMVANTPDTKAFLPTAIAMPKTPAAGGRQLPGGVTPANPKPGGPPGRPIQPGQNPTPTPSPVDPTPGPPGVNPNPPPVRGGDKPGQPSPTENPDPYGAGPNFAKGQSRDQTMPGDQFSPYYESVYGSGYNPYNGSGGAATGGQPSSYDPLGIGADAYGDPSQSYYPMEGVNSVLGASGATSAQYGLVGGQGGYGVGMVGKDYSGPIFGDTNEVMKAMRKQRKALARTTRAVNNGPVTADPNAPAGKPGQPAATTTTPATGTGTGTTAAGKPGQPATTPTTPAATDPSTGWSKPDANGNVHTADGRTLSPFDQQQEKQMAAGNATVGGVTQSHTDQYGNPISEDQYDQFQADWRKNLTMLSPDTFNTPMGTLTTASGGNANIFKKANGGEDDLYQYDPEHLGPGDDPSGWKHMTPSLYQGYGDHPYTSPTSSVARAKAAGAQQTTFQRLQ